MAAALWIKKRPHPRAFSVVRSSMKHRIRAFGVHLLWSVLVAAVSLALVFVVWYPGPLAAASGVGPIVLILLAVDVVVGPVITFTVFNPAKKNLKWDLAVVVALQLAALGYGLHTVFSARPAYVVFAADRFDVVYANDLTDDKLAKVTDPRFNSLPLWGPHVIAARRPASAKERNEIMFGALAGGDDVPQLPQYYVPLAEQRGQVIERLLPLDQLAEFNRGEADTVRKLLADMAAHPGGAAFLPVRGKTGDFTVIIGKASGELIRFVPLSPWQ
jgi:hypothetical protein